MSENAINGIMGTQPLSANLASVAMIGTPSAGPVIMNDYLLQATDIEGGHRLIITRGAEVQEIDIMDGQGENGVTPHIGDNGNWWLGETDTGVRAEGRDGEDGEDGASDWNDIQNKPFGEERREDYLLPETTFEMTENNGTGAYVHKLNAFPEAGQTYKVMWNGTEYSCAAIGEEDAGALLIFIGNAAIFEAGPDTGEPFAFALVGNEKTASALGMSGMLLALDGSASATASIFGLADFIYKLDKKYVDLGEPSNIQNGESQGSVRTVMANTGVGTGAAAFGITTGAYGEAAFAEGKDCYANGDHSHAEGLGSDATGGESHAEGNGTSAVGFHSHAEGLATIAIGSGSHTEGDHTIANGDNQHVQGRSNIEDKEGKYAHIVGNGGALGSSRSNAHTLDWGGNAWFRGDILVGGEGQEDPAAEKLVKTGELAKALQNLPKPENGISPTVQIEDIDGGHRVTITDAEGAKSFDVLNGKDGGGSGGGTQVQANWEQNDPEAPDYVKGRTHYEIPPKFDIRWDGDMTGRFALPLDALGSPGAYAVKVSDMVLRVEEVIKTEYHVSTDGESAYATVLAETIDSTTIPGAYHINGWIICVTSEDIVNAALGMPSGTITNGIYFSITSDRTMYVDHFVGNTYIKKIDEKYMPESYGTDYVRYSMPQNLDSKQKEQARKNIGALDEETTEVARWKYLFEILNGKVPTSACKGSMIRSLTWDGIKVIGAYAFNGCYALEIVDLSNLEEIGSHAFANCLALETVILRGIREGLFNKVALYGSSVFFNTPIESGTGYIYVPAALVDEYKATTGWSSYASQIRAIEDYPEITGG